MIDEKALEAAVDAFAKFGIRFYLPSEGDLDDVEREQYEALCAAIKAYEAAKSAEPVAYIEPEDVDTLKRGGSIVFFARDREKIGVPLFLNPPAKSAEPVVTVKPLKWGDLRHTEDYSFACDARTSIGTYIAADNGWFLLGQSGWEKASSMNEAKAAAQADYEHRILSALDLAPQPKAPVVTDEMVDALKRIRDTAMKHTLTARIPECAEFGCIAQDADWLLNEFTTALNGAKPKEADE